ncbi:MAG TPA: S-adenosylmethionine:tRNA ribosyltransferase-isomerase, partial [Limnochordia bacterium]|nr:S-adenosylmethionine:tRNA ribosyltransferase-isomerase [Limnochordia bacterium]
MVDLLHQPLTGIAAATEPPEARGLVRDQVRLLAQERLTGDVRHAAFVELPHHLRSGDLLVVNDSAVRAASLPIVGSVLRLNSGTELPDGERLVELQGPDGALLKGPPDGVRSLQVGGPGAPERTTARATVRLSERYPGFRTLWRATVEGDLAAVERRAGRPISYDHLRGSWPLSAYQTIFARRLGSAEMPSAGRPFSRRVVRALAERGVELAALTLHTGLSSHEDPAAELDELPGYPEWFDVPAATAAAVNRTRRRGDRVIAVGTTVVRALESAIDEKGEVQPAQGYTDLMITPKRGVRAVDGLLTGLHVPGST